MIVFTGGSQAGSDHTYTNPIVSFDVPDSFVPYNPASRSISVTFPDSVGTVYSGTLDVVTGVLTVKWVRELIKNLSWTYQSAQTRFYTASVADSVKRPLNNGDVAELLCECFKTTSFSAYQDMDISVATGGNIFLKCSTYTDKESFVSALGDCAITYALATPLTYQLTPQEVLALVGENNVWASTNGDVTVTYRSN